VQEDEPLTWVRGEFCGGGACVEAAVTADANILVRDSKNLEGPILAFDRSEWQAFVTGVRAGNFDFN